MSIKTCTYTLDTIDAAVDLLDAAMSHSAIITLDGPLGAGKTTLVQELLARRGVTGEIVSPTFTYVVIYVLPDGKTIYHFDLYRIPSLQAFVEMGFVEYLYQPDSWAIIEWPEIIAPLLTQAVCACTIEHVSEVERKLTLKQ